MNVVVKKFDDVNKSRIGGNNMIASILNDSNTDFDAIGEPGFGNSTLKAPPPVTSLTRMFSQMSAINVSANCAPILVETSVYALELSLKEEINPLEPQDTKLAFTNTKNLIIGIILLFSFIIPGACVGPIIMSLPAEDAVIKSLWRTQGNLVIAIPITALLYICQKDQMSFTRDHSPRMIMNNLIIAFFSFGCYICLVIACSMTITSHAMVMSSSAGVYMFAFALITGVTIHRYEYFGYVLFAIGIIMMLTDPFAIKEGGTGNQYLGDIIAFSGALSGAIQGIFNSKNYKLIHPVVLMTHCMAFFVIFQLIMASVMFGPTIVFSFDKGYGAFGWLANTNILVYTLVVVAPIFGFVNNVAFNISYFFWPMEIIAGAVLTQPFFSQAAGVMMGQDCMPGFRTIFGLTAITIGSLASSYGSRLKAMLEVQKICKDDLAQSRLGMVSLQNIAS